MFEEAPREDILEIYVSEGACEKICAQTSLDGMEYIKVRDDIFGKMSDTRTPQGILTVMRRREHALNDILGQENPLIVVLDNLNDPGNLGTIIRTGEGAGVTGVIMGNGTVDIYNPKVIRSTMGSIYRVPFVYVNNLRDCVLKMHELKINTYAAHLNGETYYDGPDFCEPTAFLIGNEARGLCRELADCAKCRVKITMEGRVESLNAAIASALLMYEAHKQRWKCEKNF